MFCALGAESHGLLRVGPWCDICVGTRDLRGSASCFACDEKPPSYCDISITSRIHIEYEGIQGMGWNTAMSGEVLDLVTVLFRFHRQVESINLKTPEQASVILS